MEILKRFLYVVALSAFVFAGCSDDDEDLIGNQEKEISGLTEDLRKLQADYDELKNAKEALEETKEGLEKEKEKLENEKKELELQISNLETGKNNLENEKKELEAEKIRLEGKLNDAEIQIEQLSSSIESLEDYKGKLDKLLGEVSEQDYTGLVVKVLEGLETLANVKALCVGDYEESTIKEYIDTAVKSLTSSLGNYVLATTFDQFQRGYEAFKEKIESAGYATTEDVEALFTKENRNFNKGVLDVVKDAVEQGELSDALQEAVRQLGDTYASKVDDLIKRVEKLEAQVAGLLGRIQSLVYVPKTADGKIHFGTSYISDKSDMRKKINLSSAKKLEYRVSPAELRDYLLQYEEEVTFSFYQAHVSREGIMAVSAPQGLRLRQSSVATRADVREGCDGLNEFNVVKIEAGNDAGTLLITVDNEHDFTHEDLAVALCIRQNNTNTGVLTEYTSAYTTVVGEGADLTGRFYLAKGEDGTYSKISRADRIDYTLVYNDETPVRFMQGYEVVYDNGETVMSLAEAKEKYEWDNELEYKISRTGEIFDSNWQNTNYIIKPENYQKQMEDELIFQINSNAVSSDNIGKKWGCEYKVSLSKEGESVDILSNFEAYVIVMPTEYIVDAHITWNSGKWYKGKSRGWHHDEAAYTSDRAVLKYKKNGRDESPSSLEPHIRREIFGDGQSWTIDYIPDNIKVDNTLDVNVATNIQDLNFTVKGYKYSEDEQIVKISRKDLDGGIPTSGSKNITVTGQLTFEGPTNDDLNIKIGSAEKPVVMETDVEKYKGQGNGSPYALMYLQLAPLFIPQDKVVPVNSKFFTGGSPFAYAKVNMSENVTCTKAEGGDENAPGTLELMYYDKTGGRPSPLLHSVNVKSDGFKAIVKETVYTLDKGFDIVLDDGPTIKVTGGTFKFIPSE